ncbi:hypothetical protein CPSG_03103 [Coccidioides posadasii str. Silveira]|uniref:Uncharacterized protein n=1 Tax=Coccidioides posadasii (strain RMSCC 757 / Silveira) TaxID=443226 RepID=E9D0S4_COCPS|nr:hypothetical protein CPSG_03103 [Coccidioides posadasii str. Silveira]
MAVPYEAMSFYGETSGSYPILNGDSRHRYQDYILCTLLLAPHMKEFLIKQIFKSIPLFLEHTCCLLSSSTHGIPCHSNFTNNWLTKTEKK